MAGVITGLYTTVANNTQLTEQYKQRTWDRASNIMRGKDKITFKQAISLLGGQNGKLPEGINSRAVRAIAGSDERMVDYTGDIEYVSQKELATLLAAMDGKVGKNGEALFDSNIEPDNEKSFLNTYPKEGEPWQIRAYGYHRINAIYHQFDSFEQEQNKDSIQW